MCLPFHKAAANPNLCLHLLMNAAVLFWGRQLECLLPVHKRSDGERLEAAERGAQLQRPPQPTGIEKNLKKKHTPLPFRYGKVRGEIQMIPESVNKK